MKKCGRGTDMKNREEINVDLNVESQSKEILLKEATDSNLMYVDNLLKVKKMRNNIHGAQQCDSRIGKYGGSTHDGNSARENGLSNVLEVPEARCQHASITPNLRSVRKPFQKVSVATPLIERAYAELTKRPTCQCCTDAAF
ncbi:hypothetical protein RJT34_21520 [Clitoria ternatea]|uniref:Uncharacterized protein n=1 Tax=Clitoria ternatea TaxID=43366 RepID=A0AAN9IVF6_CLITE